MKILQPLRHTAASLALLLAAGGPVGLSAQAPPGTDLFLVEIEEDADGAVRTGPVRRLTDRDGYDNQPFFLPDGTAFLYTSIDDTGQADIWLHELGDEHRRNLTGSAPESEYSGTPVPGRGIFSAIRVEADSTQRLWAFPGPGAGELDRSLPDVLLPAVEPVGYHAWLDDHRVALFVLGQPSTLQVADVESERTRLMAWDVGRSMHRLPAGAARLLGVRADDRASDAATAPVRPVSFLQWRAEGPDRRRVGTIKVLDPWTGAIEAVAPALEGNEYYAWTPTGTLLMGQGPVLHAYRPGRDDGWRQIADLSPQGITEITRLAVSPDGTQMVLVSSR